MHFSRKVTKMEIRLFVRRATKWLIQKLTDMPLRAYTCYIVFGSISYATQNKILKLKIKFVYTAYVRVAGARPLDSVDLPISGTNVLPSSTSILINTTCQLISQSADRTADSAGIAAR